MDRTLRNALDDPALIDVRRAWVRRLEDLFAGRPGRHVCVLQGIQEYTTDADLDWQDWLDRALEALARQADRARDVDVFRPLIVNYDPYGVHFIDRLFGADVFPLAEGGWQVRPLASPVGSLRAPELEAVPEWQTMKQVAQAFLEVGLAGVSFALPTIASALNVALNLYGQEILFALFERPAAARRDLDVINELLCRIHRWYRAAMPPEQLQCIVPDGRFQPPGYGQLCGCSTHLLSPELYRDFIAPLDARLLSVYPHGGMIHLCGDHDQHIPTWRGMRAVRALQLNDRASTDLEAYVRGLRDDQVLYVHPCASMPVERIVEITGGRRLVLVAPAASSAESPISSH